MAIPIRDRLVVMEPAGVNRLESRLIALVRKDPELRSYWLKGGE